MSKNRAADSICDGWNSRHSFLAEFSVGTAEFSPGFFSVFAAAGFASVVVFYDVLHDERDAAVGGVEWIVEFAETLIGKSADLGDLVRPDAVGLHEAAGGVGAVAGEFPVTVAAGGGIGFGIGVAFDRKRVGQLAEFLGESDEQLAAVGI